MEPVVSIIVPAYNVTAYIAETLESILAQTRRDFEIIVVNDACPDTFALEAVLQAYNDQIRYIKHDRNAGLAAARNTGIRAARGEFVALIDADDAYEPEYLQAQVEKMRIDPAAAVVYCDAKLIGDDPCVGMPISAFRPSKGPVTVASLLREEVSVTVMCLIRRAMLLNAGLFDSNLRSCEDLDLWLRIAKLGNRIVYNSEVLARYRIRGESLSRDPWNMYHHRTLVLDKIEREMTLTADEEVALKEARVRWKGDFHLHQCKRDFAEGNYQAAAEHLDEANRYFRLRKYKVVVLLLRRFPKIVRGAKALRDVAQQIVRRLR